MAEEDPFQGGDEAFEVMAPMLVEKLQVSYTALEYSSKLYHMKLTPSGRRNISSRYQKACRGRISHRRSCSFHTEEGMMYHQGDQ